jgi:Skp family chaperone for outer membrane proteins
MFSGDKMKLIFSVAAALFFAVFTLSAEGQTTSPPVAAQQAMPVKLAVVDTEAFADPKTGVQKLINAINQLEAEFKPKRDEITSLQARYTALVNEIQNAQKTGAAVDPAKVDQAQQLESDIKRKQEDGQKTFERRSRQVTDPLNTDLAKALTAYARTKGYDVVLDAAKFAGTMIVVNQGIDITDAFIADYNAKNPAAAPAVRP